MLAASSEIVKKIPADERWNLYYTVAKCTGGKREFKEQDVIIFDIDGVTKGIESKYVIPVLDAIGVLEKNTAIVASGNGLHFIIALTTPITDAAYFDANRRHYVAVCDKIKHALIRAGLDGTPDPSVFDARRIMRLPGTENRKDGKPTQKCKALTKTLRPVDFDLTLASGLPQVTAKDQIAPQGLKNFPPADSEAVQSGCNFLKFCKEKPNEVSEAQWYGMLSILPRLANGRDLAHAYSKGHPSYSYGETESKIDQALAASGPRTCSNINGLWNKCASCPNFERVASPIMIQGESYIKTRDSGFHYIKLDESGVPKPAKPAYSDLRKFFELEHNYIVLGESGICLTWNGKFWEPYEDIFLKNFAQANFDPPADNKMVSEFVGIVCRTNLRSTDWFISTTSRKVNFNNCVLDLDTMQTEPHSQSYGFRYCLPYNYDPEAKCPVFEDFLIQIMCGRSELIDVLLEFAGYAFSNDECWAQKALIMTGVGSNGKSTFMDVLRNLAGKSNYSSLTFSDLKHEATRQMVDGKLFNLSEETPTHALAESYLFKNMVGGGEISVKTLYKQPYTIVTKTKLMFACNELPRTRDTTKGFFRRLIIVPFDKLFEGATADPFIKQKLIQELPGIFNLVIEGYKRLRKQQGFSKSVVIDDEIKKYHRDLDTVKAWVEDCITLEPPTSTLRITLSMLYGSYKIYAENAGEKPETQVTMSRRLSTLLPGYADRKKQETVKGKRETVFHGVKCFDSSNY